MSDSKLVSIHETGETTGKTWAGEFEVRPFLSSRQYLERDRAVRQLLGDAPQYSLEIERATKIADCQVGLTKSPEWWKESAGGLDLVDDNILNAVHAAVIGVQKEARAAVIKKAEDAKALLKTDAAKPDEAA